MRWRVVSIILLLALAATGAVSQETEPPWLVIERAERLMIGREFGLAIQSFRQALQLSPENPQALFGLGRAYKAVGDPVVAEEYFARALARRAAFEVPATALLVRYERADVYRTRRDFGTYERELFAIIEEDPIPEDAILPEDVRVVIARRGLDRLLVLYRLEESGATRARGMLAEHLVGLGRYDGAAEQAAIAVLQAFTTLIDAVRHRDPTYEFETVDDLWARARRLPEADEYLATSNLYHDLYFLAAAFWGEGERAAFDLWRTLAVLDPDRRWGERAARQLADPQPEPLLIPMRER